MEILRPVPQIEALAQSRLKSLDDKIYDLETEKARITEMITDYGILFDNPIWPAVVDMARQLPSAYLAFANPESRDIQSAGIILAWGFSRSDIYPGHESWQQGLPKKKSLTWRELNYGLHKEPGQEPAPVLNGKLVDLTDKTALQTIESALGYASHRGGWGDREVRRGENIRTSTLWKRIPLEDLA